MRPTLFPRRSIVPIAALVLAQAFFLSVASSGSPQNPSQPAQHPAFKPEVGQAGKDVVWVPTPQALVDKMLDMAKVTPDDTVMDLGSGDGITVITAAKRGAKAVGIEYNPDMVELSRANAEKAGVSGKATFRNADLFEMDLSEPTVITMFLLPQINMRLRPKILDLKPGTRIVSNSFNMEDWIPDETATVTEGCETWCTAMLWIVPARIEGQWKSAGGDLSVVQTFQQFTGTLQSGSESTPITEGRLSGASLTMTIGAARYEGRVNGHAIEGTVTEGEKTRPWRASRLGS